MNPEPETTCDMCGHRGTVSSFFGDLPRYEMKCPVCGHHWRVIVVSPMTWNERGTVKDFPVYGREKLN
jgi:hypothetical protein